jgi:G1/S-specific cyclin-D2
MNKMDQRTLGSMLKLEENYVVVGDYFNATIKPEMRSKLATWMLEVCEEQECTDDVYATAMNIFDRLMCVLRQVEVYHLQLLGSVCLFISSKLSSSHKLSAVKLVDYTDNSISLEDLLEWELFVMDKLRWDVCSIVPNEFVDVFLQSFDFNEDMNVLKKHCYAFTAMCATDFKFSKYPSSLVASACILNALEGLQNRQLEQFAYTLNASANIDFDFLLMVKEQVSHLFKQSSQEEEQTIEISQYSESIQFEDDYDFDIEYNMAIENNCYMTKERQSSHKGLAKTLLLSPAPSNASSSGVSSNSSLLSPSLLSSSYYTNQDMISMMMVTPPLANSLPMPEFDSGLRRSARHQQQRLIQC